MVVIWLQLMCLAGNCNDGGRIYLTEEIPYTEQMLAAAFSEPLSTVQMALHTFEMFGMIETIDDIIYISNWEKYQSIEGMEKIREQARLRMKNYRERQKQLSCNVTVTQPLRNVTGQNKNKSKNKEILSKESIKKRPTLEEVTEYVRSRGNLIDPQKFYDYYEAAGWKDSKGQPVKNWKQKAITWENHRTPQSNSPEFSNPYKQEAKKEPQMTPEEAKEWYDNLMKELQDGQRDDT